MTKILIRVPMRAGLTAIPLAFVLAACGGGAGPSGGEHDSVDAGTESSADAGSELAGVASVTFATGALPAGSAVALQKAADAATLRAFDEGAGSFDVRDRINYYVRITTGRVQPAGPATVELSLPAGFVVASGKQAELFARIYTQNEDEGLDAFAPLERVAPTGAGVVRATLPPWAFTSVRSADGTVEAAVMIATVPSASSPHGAQVAAGRFCESPAAACSVACMRTPLLRTLRSKRGLNLAPGPADPSFHPGIDLRAEIGTDAVAVGSGTVLESRLSSNVPADCKYPENCPNKGMGETILLDVAGVGRVRYMHLWTRAIGDCCTGNHCARVAPGLEPCAAAVVTGQKLGLTGNTGYSQEAHLHLELLSSGAILDPAPCILPPDYHGHFQTWWTIKSDQASFELTANARVKFRYSEEEHQYRSEGTWTLDIASLGPECTYTIENASGSVGPTDGVLKIGGLQDDQLKAFYLPAAGPLTYEGGGITLPNPGPNGHYNCGPLGSGTWQWPYGVSWWPLSFLMQNHPFFAKPNPWDKSSPFEDFVEDHQNTFLTGGNSTQTANWNVSAWQEPP